MHLFSRFITTIGIVFLLLLLKRVINKKYWQGGILISQSIYLALFFIGALNELSLSYFTFDVIWWSLACLGCINSYLLNKRGHKLRYLSWLITGIYLVFIYPMMLMENM